jgi:hypothetical protein
MEHIVIVVLNVGVIPMCAGVTAINHLKKRWT